MSLPTDLKPAVQNCSRPLKKIRCHEAIELGVMNDIIVAVL